MCGITCIFCLQLSSLYESKPPVSRAKMASITKTALKAVKFYKHVVQSVEKFILKVCLYCTYFQFCRCCFDMDCVWFNLSDIWVLSWSCLMPITQHLLTGISNFGIHLPSRYHHLCERNSFFILWNTASLYVLKWLIFVSDGKRKP